MFNGSQSLGGQGAREMEEWSSSNPQGGRYTIEELITALRKGALLLKHGRQGKPKVHYFRISPDGTELRWKSSGGSVRSVALASVITVLSGQSTDVFKRHPLKEAARSFSLLYSSSSSDSTPEGSAATSADRSLDLTCTDEAQFEIWANGVILAVQCARQGQPLTLLSTSFNTSNTSAAVAAEREGGGLLGNTTNVAATTTNTGSNYNSSGVRQPTDVYIWGNAPRGIQPSLTQQQLGDSWPKGPSPTLLPGNTTLDAGCIAVGRRHAALSTSIGCLFTWGEGRLGKLGQGHDADHFLPGRVRGGVPRGTPVRATACGDDCTAALLQDGSLYLWGRVSPEVPPAMLPAPMRGGLRGKKVASVSCGPFHCAAVTEDGGLFTWGEGFGGRLGHGDQSSRAQPTQVEALEGSRVLGVACGVWHTAAIVVESPALLLLNDPCQSGSTALTPSITNDLDSLGVSATTTATSSADKRERESSTAAAAATTPRHHHRRGSSVSSATELSSHQPSSSYTEGAGGALYTWGGVSEPVAFGDSQERRDSNKGCLGHGSADLYAGRLLPCRVGGALEPAGRSSIFIPPNITNTTATTTTTTTTTAIIGNGGGLAVRRVAAGSHLTVAVTTSGLVYQMGVTGANAPGKGAPWEGAALPEQVRGALSGHFIDSIACGMHHVLCVARPIDRKLSRPADLSTSSTPVFAWGRGGEGQLGTGRWEDSATPVQVESLKGKHVVSVACGGANSAACCAHDMGRYEVLGGKEQSDGMTRVLYGLLESAKESTSTKLQPSLISRGASEKEGLVRSTSGRSVSFSFSGNFGSSRSNSNNGRNTQPLNPQQQQQQGPPVLSRISASSSMRSFGTAHSKQQQQHQGNKVGVDSFMPKVFSLSSPSLSSDAATEAALKRRESSIDLGPTGSCTMTGISNMTKKSLSMLSHSQSMRSTSSFTSMDTSRDGGDVSVHGAGGASLGGKSPSVYTNTNTNDITTNAGTNQRVQEQYGSSSFLPPADVTALVDATRQLSLKEAVAQGIDGFRAGQHRKGRTTTTSPSTAGIGVGSLERSVRPTLSSREVGIGVGLRGGESGGSVVLDSPSVSVPRSVRSIQSDVIADLTLATVATAEAVQAMQKALAAKEAEIEAQKSKLTAWEAELQRKEENLKRQEEALSNSTTPHTLSPTKPTPSTAGTAGPLPPPQPSSISTISPMKTDGGHSQEESMNEDDWLEQAHPGVTLTFTLEQGVKRLKRIRFARDMFTKESAVQWYEENKHRLGSTGCTPTSPGREQPLPCSSSPKNMDGGGAARRVVSGHPSRQDNQQADTGLDQVSSMSSPSSNTKSNPGANPSSNKPPLNAAGTMDMGVGSSAGTPSPGYIGSATPSGLSGLDSTPGAMAEGGVLLPREKDPVRQLAYLHGRESSKTLSFDGQELAQWHAAVNSSAVTSPGVAAAAMLSRSPSTSRERPQQQQQSRLAATGTTSNMTPNEYYLSRYGADGTIEEVSPTSSQPGTPTARGVKESNAGLQTPIITKTVSKTGRKTQTQVRPFERNPSASSPFINKFDTHPIDNTKDEELVEEGSRGDGGVRVERRVMFSESPSTSLNNKSLNDDGMGHVDHLKGEGSYESEGQLGGRSSASTPATAYATPVHEVNVTGYGEEESEGGMGSPIRPMPQFDSDDSMDVTPIKQGQTLPAPGTYDLPSSLNTELKTGLHLSTDLRSHAISPQQSPSSTTTTATNANNNKVGGGSGNGGKGRGVPRVLQEEFVAGDEEEISSKQAAPPELSSSSAQPSESNNNNNSNKTPVIGGEVDVGVDEKGESTLVSSPSVDDAGGGGKSASGGKSGKRPGSGSSPGEELVRRFLGARLLG